MGYQNFNVLVLQKYWLILMNFTRYEEQTHRGLYTNFQSNPKFYKNIEIFSFIEYRCVLWPLIYIEKLTELSYLLIVHENKLVLS